MSFFEELKRRNVVRVGIAYVLLGWVVLQGADFMLDLTGAPEWIIRVFAVAGVVGLPFALFFAWAFELTPEGIKRESEIDRSQSVTPQTGRKLDRVIIVFLVLAVGALVAERLVNPSGTGQIESGDAAAQKASVVPAEPTIGDEAVSSQSIAVLPFVAMSNGPDDGYFADGLTEEILNALAQLPELLVTARTSAFSFKGQDVSIQEIAARLGVAHIVEGSVRRSGDRLRVTAQLIRASDGFHLWSNNYDSSSADTIAVQEDIAGNIAVALNVVLDEHKREQMQQKGLRDVEAFIAFQRGRELYEQAHVTGAKITDGLKQANKSFEEVQRLVPEFSAAWLMHSDLYVHQILEDSFGTQPEVDSDGEVTVAFNHARADYEKAIRYAQTPEERISLELDLAYLTGNWRGLTDRIEKFLDQEGCISSAWFEAVILPFGYAERLQPRVESLVACEPLDGSSWRALARSRIWDNDPDGVIDVSLRGLEAVDSDSLVAELAKGMLLKGQDEEAQIELDTRIKSIRDSRSVMTEIAAMRGDRESTEALMMEYQRSGEKRGFTTLAMYAWAGDRAAANRLAAEFDQHPFGHIALSIAVLVCECRAPWDLSSTPVFAEKIAESGLSWPPLSPITFPFKDW